MIKHPAMPRLPLFQGEPLHPNGIESFRYLFDNPEEGSNMQIITDLLDLSNDPSLPITDDLALFVVSSGLIRSPVLLSFIGSNVGRVHPPGKRREMLLQINERILACAAAAGFRSIQKH